MARIARIVAPGFPHHVTQRGSRRQQTFFTQADYRYYIDLLKDSKIKSDVSVWAYCLMPNHVHLIVVPQTDNGLSKFLGPVHRKYALAINHRMQWRGHLWQERFHSFVMDERHLLAGVRYVELNPVRARLCHEARDWQWSSPHFSPGDGMIAQCFGFTRDFLKERNNSAYFRLKKIPCEFKEQARARHPGEKCGLARISHHASLRGRRDAAVAGRTDQRPAPAWFTPR